ncbi:MAG: Acetyl-coenzyme A carboxylase carboxyl transferase subunit alpha [Alphaproteobacteria bacterium MarineAlpha9_Bin4]|nr:acetyl-CoA carboxylase carboxyl transferase subunit alpha [Pelagibacterales bacterium]PPR27085.1 MAG: Acetyl-coenzyme A carboxylase carboxyl transferase subunit alpha [Alphaproteobacteria bacterium MarineAlpha9_Bin4]
MIKFFLDFENEIAQIEGRINELRHMSTGKSVSILKEITDLEFKANKILKEKYSNLTPWQRVQVARHPDRPHSADYINNLFDDFIPLSGDRKFGEDSAIIGGLASFDGTSVMLIAQEKGSDTESRLIRNFGMAKPEGYRKSIRLMKLADKFNIPIITLIDTAGAYPGIGAEQRGQSEAIASSIKTCLNVKVPLISIIIGEGGSGGAVALATADKVLMLENSIYSVISPEGCASILWKVEGYDEAAANNLKITSEDLKRLKVIDQVIKEPLGGAHRNPSEIFTTLKKELTIVIKDLNKKSKTLLSKERKLKYLKFGSNFTL